MDTLMITNEIQTFIDAVKSLVDTSEDLTDEMVKLALEQITENLKPTASSQSVNQIIQGLETQGLTKEEAAQSLNALKAVINERMYGDEDYIGNKKLLIDGVLAQVYSLFDLALDKYHSYNIELPMTVDTEAGAKVPTYAHDTDAAADIYAMADQTIGAHTYGNMIRTGVKLQLPEGWQALILPRSSIGTKTPLRLSNSIGLIDSGYRGELGVLYDNTSDNDYQINAGDRIAQLLVMPTYRFRAQVVDVLTDSDRGEGGFGSSGA